MEIARGLCGGVRARERKLRRACVATIGAAFLFVAWGFSAAQAAGDQNLPIYTSPIDITGLKLLLRAVAPDRNTGKPVEIPLPTGPLGPRMNALLSAPLSDQLNLYWAHTPDPNTGTIPRDKACNGDKGIIQRVKEEVHKQGSSYSAYDVACNLASTGMLVAKQVGSTLYLSYILTHNSVSFNVTTPYTCHAHHGTLVCPDDPHFTVQFVSEITTAVRTPDICHITADNGVVTVHDVSFDGSSSLTGSIAQLADALFLGHKFSAAELSMENSVSQVPLPLDAALKELRNSEACSGRNPLLSRALTPFRTVDTEIQPPQGVIVKAVHAPIAAPNLDAPDAWSGPGKSSPTFTHPMISANQPLVVAGSSIQIRGQYFPPNNIGSLADRLPITLSHGGYGANSIIAGGVCWGGFTEVRWNMMGTPFGASRVVQLQGGADGACAQSYEVSNLIPATTYEVRARDCDKITCSPWSTVLKRMTAAAGGATADKGTVTLIIDRNAECKAPWCGPALNSRVAQQANVAPASSNGIPTSGPCETPLCRVGMSSSALKAASNPSPCDTPLCRSAQSSAASVIANTNSTECKAPWCRNADKSAHTSQIPIPIGSAVLTPQGTFAATVNVPSSVAPGVHSIWASNGDAEAEVAINVRAPNSAGGASIMVIAVVAASESGCPNRPSSSVMGDSNFMLFGAGFKPGTVSVFADRAMSTRPLGTAAVRADGTFCEQMRGISGRELGPHTVLAVENGAVQAQEAITVVAPTHTQVN